MVTSFCHQTSKPPTWYELRHAILRNFGGLDGVEPVTTFARNITNIHKDVPKVATDPECSPIALIEVSLFGNKYKSKNVKQDMNAETRYLLILTEAYAALDILQQYKKEMGEPITIFGSSFPKDQEYTQVNCSLHSFVT